MLERLPKALLHAEGAVIFAASLAIYIDGDWSILALVFFFLAPDITVFAFLANPRVGALAYDVAHTEVWPLALAAAGVLADASLPTQIGLIWLAHIGLDRMLGFGLKYPTRFEDTHLGRV